MKLDFRKVAVHCALVAMLLRAFLPDGWMPNPGASANTPLIICTMDGTADFTPAADKGPLKQHPGQHGDRSHEACPFAAAPHLAPPAILAALSPASLAVVGASKTQPTRVSAAIIGYTPQSPRAPPQFS